MSDYSTTTEALYQGDYFPELGIHPETIPCFLTTAFTMKGFQEVQETYQKRAIPIFGPVTPTVPLWERCSLVWRAVRRL